jgi:UDP-N-acetylmuramate: L-alanyl-gamma-D-glutamyl-meso-diaminopimelate ligase
VCHEDSENTRDVTAHAQARVEGYGLLRGLWRADRIEHGPGGVGFRILREGQAFAQVALPVSGEYNVRNALAVTAAAHEQGLTPAEIAKGLSTFQGVKRRMDVVGESAGVVVLDDFAHHPTAIGETLRAVRQRYPGRRVVAVLEPRSGSLRRKVFQDKLPAAFDAADEIVLAEVFGADKLQPEERLDPSRLVADIAARGRTARFLPGVEAIVAYLAQNAKRGDVIAVLSNGGFGGIHQKLLEALSRTR